MGVDDYHVSQETETVPKTFEEAVDQILTEMRKVIVAKQHDYGPRNITDFGELGCLIRANDKIARLRNLLWNKDGSVSKTPKNEAIDDSWLDLGNYTILAQMAKRGWMELPVGEMERS